MNDHLAILIYLTAAECRPARLVVSRFVLKVMDECRGRGEQHLCNDALQQLSRVSVYAMCGHGVRLPHKLPAAITSFHQLTASTNRLHLQLDRGGGVRVESSSVLRPANTTDSGGAAVSWSSP